MNKDIEQAITNLRVNPGRRAKSERYYNGDHDLAFATEKFQNTFGTLFREFALNLCPVICDAVRDKLRVTGFSVDSGGTLASLPASRDLNGKNTPAGSLRSIWQRNRMRTRAGEVHKEVLKCGDAYMIVWPDDEGRAVMYPNRAANVTVAYDEAAPGRIIWAAKAWTGGDKRVRLNLFYPDRIEKYISQNESPGTLPDAAAFQPLGERAGEKVTKGDGEKVRIGGTNGSLFHGRTVSPSVVSNPYGVVPVFHFANNADMGMAGRSELDAAIPVQDGLNKAVLDMLVAMEYSAFRQRWAAGIETEMGEDGKAVTPFKAGVDQLWLANNPDAKFGDFAAAELEQFLKVKDSFRIDMASVTGTPIHYFLQTTANLPSGESLKKAETRFLSKIRDRQESFGQVWADAMSFALMIEGRGRDIQLITEWEDPAPMSDREFLENILLKKQIGLPVEQALIEAGYGAADVKRMI